MSLPQLTTLHAQDGAIAWLSGPQDAAAKLAGNYPWNLAVDDDRSKVQSAIGLTLLKQPTGVVRYQLVPLAFPNGLWMAESLFERLPSADYPILGKTTIFNGLIENLSPRERQIAKLLPEFPVKQIARILKVSTSTVETFRGRIGLKVGITGGQLVAWCADHHELLS